MVKRIWLPRNYVCTNTYQSFRSFHQINIDLCTRKISQRNMLSFIGHAAISVFFLSDTLKAAASFSIRKTVQRAGIFEINLLVKRDHDDREPLLVNYCAHILPQKKDRRPLCLKLTISTHTIEKR